MSFSKYGEALLGRGQRGYPNNHGLYAASSSYGQSSSSPRYDVTDHSKSATEKAKELGIMISRPKHPEFAVKISRLKTFDSWPTYLRQKPADLAEAGFFYSGKEDNVFCFYCGQGLHSWEQDDEPWVEHAKWYPECVFVLNVKGKNFVEMVKYGQTEPPLMAAGTDSMPLNGDIVNSQESKLKNDLFETPAVQSLVLNGYKKEDIKKAVEIWNKMKRNTDFSASDILQVIFELEEGNIRYEDYVRSQEEKPAYSESHAQPSPNIQSYEQQLQKENKTLREAMQCKVCKEEQVCIVFLPCGHVCCCETCGPAMKHCPSCQQFVKGTIKTYLV